MPTYQEIKDLSAFIVSDEIDAREFALYINFALADLSEIMKHEKEMTEFPITSNDNATDLPSDLFQIISVVIDKEGESNNKEIAFEVGVNDEESVNDRFSRLDRRNNVYSRWDSKIRIKSIYLNETSGNTTLNVNIKYYGSLPTLVYDAETLDLSESPPIIEQHYHAVLANYVAYMYYTNQNMSEEANSQNQIYLLKKNQIKDYVNKHRHNSNLNSKIRLVRR